VIAFGLVGCQVGLGQSTRGRVVVVEEVRGLVDHRDHSGKFIPIKTKVAFTPRTYY